MYDIIGDIHGHGNDLIQLLRHLGYRKEGECWRHPTHKAIFLGDFIDRGQNQRLVLDTVMPMVQQGVAYAVMGNHEFNALGFHTPDPDNPEAWLRKRSDKNIHQHLAFLQEYLDNSQKLGEVLAFFRSLPLWLEIEGIRIIHACWDQQCIDFLGRELGGNIINHDFLVAAHRTGTRAHMAVERILKGAEITLPEGCYFFDKDNNIRTSVRADWWNSQARQIGDYTSVSRLNLGEVAELPIPDHVPAYDARQPLCFIGHYWHRGTPVALSRNVACLDYSVAKGDKLVAYRWEGERTLNNANFHYL